MLHGESVNCVAFSPDGRRVLTGSGDGSVRLWDAQTALANNIVLKHQGAVLTAHFSDDGKWILTSSDDRAARLWASDTGHLLGLPLRHSDGVSSLGLAGRTVLANTDNEVVLWTVQPTAPAQIVSPQELVGQRLAFSVDGVRVLVSDESRNTAVWWSPTTGRSEQTTLGHGEWLWGIALSPDSKRAVVAGRSMGNVQDSVVHLWSLENGERLLCELPHSDQVRAVDFSSDSKLIVTACFDGNARLWSSDSGQPVGPPLQHSTMVEDVGFSPDGTLVVTACGDGAAQIWSVKSGRQIRPPLRHRESVLAAAFSPDGKLVATGSRDHTARFWDVATGRPVGPPLEQPEWVEDVCFSPDGKRLATAHKDGSVRLWSVETGELLGPPLNLDGWAMRVQFSPDGKTLAVEELWRRAKLWTVPLPHSSGAAAEEAELRVQVLTGAEMDTNGMLNRLDRATWQARRAQLAKATDQ
jgi:WD40 repeat protein